MFGKLKQAASTSLSNATASTKKETPSDILLDVFPSEDKKSEDKKSEDKKSEDKKKSKPTKLDDPLPLEEDKKHSKLQKAFTRSQRWFHALTGPGFMALYGYILLMEGSLGLVGILILVQPTLRPTPSQCGVSGLWLLYLAWDCSKNWVYFLQSFLWAFAKTCGKPTEEEKLSCYAVLSMVMTLFGFVQFIIIRLVVLILATALYVISCTSDSFDNAIFSISWVLFMGLFVSLCLATCYSLRRKKN